jgi:2-C-methyl-D-erythritol 4-phosphate cytidylyltransferase
LSVVGIVPAGGGGERLGADGPKAFVLLGGRPLYERSQTALRTVCDRVVMAVPEGYENEPDWVVGGASRSESVRNALAAAPEATVAVVHDAARPLATAELVQRCVDALTEGVDGAIAAAPVTDTVKEVDEDSRVTHTLDRSRLWAVQTPQVFRADVLRGALDVGVETLTAATDDASLVEQAGGTVVVVAAPAENIKITSPLDLRLAEALLRAD